MLKRFDGPTNMRLDQELLNRAEAGVAGFRVYGWTGPWVSIGMYQHPARVLRPDCTTPWVRRPTGGRAVLHGHDLTIALAGPREALLATSGHGLQGGRPVRDVYRRLVEPVVQGLREAGLDACLAELTRFASKPGSSPDCFATAAENDVVHAATGRKLCGCALRLTDRGALLQASIPCGMPLLEPQRVFLGVPAFVTAHPEARLTPEQLAAPIAKALESWVRDLHGVRSTQAR